MFRAYSSRFFFASWIRLAALLLVSTLLPGLAGAQVNRVPQVAVIDLGVYADILRNSNVSGRLLSRQATDAVVNEMIRTGRFDIVPREQVSQQAEALGLNRPYNEIALQRLGQALGVDYIATGAVAALERDKKTNALRTSVVMLLTDVNSGEYANGAVGLGIALPPKSVSEAIKDLPVEQVMQDQAIGDAAFVLVRKLNNYRLPEATVLLTTANTEVRLNRGIRDGIQEGQDFVIFRQGERVGRVRITRVYDIESYATIIDIGRGIRPEDKARAIFPVSAMRY
ncbi:MAG: CsgG/HfaB family protein [Armatimonadota bacterium]